MSKRSSNLKEKVHSLNENIQLTINVTEKSIVSCDHHDKTKQPSILIVIKVKFVARKSEQAPKFLTSCNL